jgi:hypothetical protein
MYVDFSSLEPRIVLYLAGSQLEEHDIYSNLSSGIFGSKYSRDVVKKVVISQLYGRKKENIGLELRIRGTELDTLFEEIRKAFNITKLLFQIKKFFVKNGHVKNHYGRMIRIDDPSDNILLNSFVQSTGVDVSLLGFLQLIQNPPVEGGFHPLFNLHDAMIFDVEFPDKIPKELWIQVPGFDQRWPLKVENLIQSE